MIEDFLVPSIVVTHDPGTWSASAIVSPMEAGGISRRPESGPPLSAGESQTST